jgi:hypothetical protein
MCVCSEECTQRGRFNEFAKVATRFVDDAVARIELLSEVPKYGRMRAMTFAQVKRENELYPRPKKPVMP